MPLGLTQYLDPSRYVTYLVASSGHYKNMTQSNGSAAASASKEVKAYEAHSVTSLVMGVVRIRARARARVRVVGVG